MKALTAPFKDSLFSTGIILIALSLFFFCVPLLVNTDGDGNMGFFFIHFLFAAGYLFMLGIKRLLRKEGHRRQYSFLLLILFLISAYALNRELIVFATSPTWFCIVLIVLCTNYIASIFYHQLPRWSKYSILFLSGVGAIVFIYLSVYLLPLYLFGAVAMLALGISVHTFVPLAFSICTFLLANDLAAHSRRHWGAFWCGVASTLLIVIGYCVAWQMNVKAINRAYTTAIAKGNDQLPAWVQTAQHINGNTITEKILKTDLVYITPRWDNNGLWNMPQRSFGEAQQVHDPLVVTAQFFSGNIHINNDDKINILKSLFNGRHQTEERLWTGIDLRTEHVISNIRLWPENRLAYTEKIITVFNNNPSRWQEQQEAIYTFQLPEGGVVTSLSLWINGKEEKGVLTTKEKADSAYKAIVGVEYPRDPSVVHWKEGNRVSVRVFPVVSKNNRIFKIGITAPMRVCKDQLIYDNITFDGPDASSAEESITLSLSKTANPSPQPASFQSDNGNTFTRSGSYQPEWSFSVADEGLAPQLFHFNGYNYFVKPYSAHTVPVQLTDVYLDINSAWTKADFEAAWQAAKGKNIWVYDADMILLTDKNQHELFKKLTAKRFSLFPVYHIGNAESAILISKNGTINPNLSDLEGSDFLKDIKAFGQQNKKLRLFNIGELLTPYLASLKEFRFFLYEHGDLKKLQALLSSNQFVSDPENESEVVLHNAGISITKEKGEAVSNAPDHLMRLFAYNHIMQQSGQQGLSALPETSSLVQIAKEAYVVSPVSSLVVLETKADYERFDIKDSEASLKNASAKSEGAVPEPHEWVLIILGVSIAIYLFLKSRF